MADIKVRIEVNPNRESELLGDVRNVNADISNVSIKTNNSNIFQNIPTCESDGINGLSFAQDLVFDEQGYLDNEDLQGGVLESEQNPTEFVWGAVPSNKEYSAKLIFENASNLKDIIVYGNRTTNQFPTRAIIDGSIEIFNNDYRWAINLQTESDTHTIEFTHWNRENYNACLTLIAVMMRYLDYTKVNGLKLVESLSQSTGQPKDIFYGIVPSDGSIDIIDIDEEILDMVSQNVIPNSNVGLSIYANNKEIQTHKSTDSEYVGKTLSLSLSNKLNNLESVAYQGFYYQGKNETLYNILCDVLSVILDDDEIENALTDYIIINENQYTIKEYLSMIDVKYPYLPKSNLHETLLKICDVAQLQIFVDDNNNIKIISAMPSMFLNKDNVAVIPARNQMSAIEFSPLVKNKINLTNIEEYSTTLNNRSIYDSGSISYGADKTADGNFEINWVWGTTDKDPNYSYADNGHWAYIKGQIDISSLKDAFNIDVNKMSIEARVNKTDTLITQKGSNRETEVTYTSSDIVINETQLPNGISSNFKNPTITLNGDILTLDFYIRAEAYFDGVILDSEVKYTTFKASDITFYLKADAIDSSKIITTSGDVTSPNVYKNSLEDNLLLANSTKIEETNISEIISNNILNNYNNGLMTLNVTVSCSNYYNLNGKLLKNWHNGEIFKIGDIVRIDKDNSGNSLIKYDNKSDIFFRITGRKFRYAGVPLLDLELQEVKLINSKVTFNLGYTIDVNATAGIDNYLDMFINNQQVLISSISELNKNNVIIIKSKKVGSYKPTSPTINGESYVFGQEYIVTGNIEFKTTIRFVSEM